MAKHKMASHYNLHLNQFPESATAVRPAQECGKASLNSGPNQFAIDSDVSVDVTASWVAVIGDFRNSSEGFKKFVVGCSGVILSNNMVMSAAHCFDNGVVIHPEFVRVGVTRIDQTRAQDRRIKEVRIHPDRNPPAWYFDLALIILEEKLIFNGRVASLCLPESPFTHPGDGVTLLVQGWGEDINGIAGQQISEATVSSRSSQECDHRISLAGPSSVEEVETFLPDLTNSVLICADATLDAQIGACSGDSGGPAFYR